MAGSRSAGVKSDMVRATVPSGGVKPEAAGAWGPLVGEVYAHHHDRLIGFFVRRIHDRAAAQDLAHDTIMRFAGALDRFDESRPVWPYLKAVAHNVLVDHVRGQARQVPLGTEEEFAEIPEPGEALDDSVTLGRLLEGALGRLPDRQRVAIELRCARGWDVAEAAAFMGLDPGAFRQLLFRARGRLRTILAESGDQVHGLVLPVLVWMRLRARAAADRVREVAQTPAAAMSGEAFASVLVAATLGVTAVAIGAGASSADAEPTVMAMPAGRHNLGASASPARGSIVDVPPATATEVLPDPDVLATLSEGDAAPEPRTTTIIRTSDTIPNSENNVEVKEEDDALVVEGHNGASVGGHDVGATGPILTIDCQTPETRLVCDAVPHSSPEP